MTASADYGVSIIENFAPPKMWVPGEEVKKEEAVVNTGAIDAFVKQTISGVLTVTVEVPTDIAPTTADQENYITLTKDEYGSIEAGSYVAYAPDATLIGRKVIQAFTNTETGPAFVNDFKPTDDGLYIFRRAIDVEVDNTTQTTNDKAYEYVGYYYVGGTYYKLNSINKETLELVAGAEGDLASAPSVRYAKETTKTLQNVPMTYDGDNSRLVVSYSTDQNADTSALANLDRETYDAYRDYMDQKVGKTKWDITRGVTDDPAGSDDMTSWDAKNVTGLTDYDEFDHGTATANVKNDLTNWSLDRLTSRATETQTALDAASPGGKYDGSNTTTNWTTVYNEAVGERATVNKGYKSAQRLAALRDGTGGVVSLIGTGEYGLVQSDTYGFQYSAEAITADPSTGVYEVKLLNTPAINSQNPEHVNSDNAKDLTCDNMDMARFADVGGVFGDDVKWNDADRKNPYGTTASGAIKEAWDTYVNETKRLVLVNAKLGILNNAETTTDVARSAEERAEYKELLDYQKGLLTNTQGTGTYDVAKKAYEDLINGTSTTEGLKAKIQKLNSYQSDINAANEVGSATTNDSYGATAPTADPITEADAYADQLAKYPTATTATGTWRSKVASDGQNETKKEETLRDYLEAVYGVAYKDSGYTETTATYVGTADSGNSDTDLYADIFTYSPKVTKDTVDGNLTSASGVIGWTTPAASTGLATIPATATGAEYKQSDVANTNNFDGSPYYEDKKVNYMKDWREKGTGNANSVNALKDKYDTLLSNADAATQEAAQSVVGPIDLYVNLANLGNGDTKDQWQYIADATGENEYNFYYTGILQSGETSSLLIKSVEMPDTITQDMFRNLQFDLNVASESAQVTYEGDTALSTAAKAAITGADPEKDRYDQEENVKWVTPATTPKDPINDKDPNPKAETSVTP